MFSYAQAYSTIAVINKLIDSMPYHKTCLLRRGCLPLAYVYSDQLNQQSIPSGVTARTYEEFRGLLSTIQQISQAPSL